MTPASRSRRGRLQITLSLFPKSFFSPCFSDSPSTQGVMPFAPTLFSAWVSIAISFRSMLLFIFHQPAQCQFLHNCNFLLYPSLVLYPCLYCNVYLNIWLPISLSMLLSHLLDCEPLKAEVCVWFNTVPQFPPQCPPLDIQKYLGNMWMGGVHVSLSLRFRDGGPGPKPWPQAWQLRRRLLY